MRGLLFPLEANVGAAAFVRGDDVLVVFDAARPFDLSGVQDDSVGGRSSIQLLPEATILRLPGRRAKGLALRRLPTGWLIRAAGAQSTSQPIIPAATGAVLRLPVGSPGRTIVVPDPQTGGNLLVGTIRRGNDAVDVSRHGSAELIEQTIQGIVVDPFSDRLELRPTIDAFLLSGSGADTLQLSSTMLDAAAGHGGGRLQRLLSLQSGPPDILLRRFKDAKAASAAAPAGARFVPRLIAAEDALALGDAAQAATIARVAVTDDAREASTPRSRLLIAAAALAAHHPDDNDLLDDPQTTADGEIGLWRAVKLAEGNSASPEAARLFAANLPLLRSYPAPLQTILLPLAGEALVRGGTDAQAAMLDRLPPDASLAFARALLAERRGQTQSALAALDRLSSSKDLRVSDNAAEEAVAVRQGVSASQPGKLADMIEAHLLDARIAGHELATRFRIADLRLQARQWRKALDLLRETATAFPEQRAEATRRVGTVLKRMASAPVLSGDNEAFDQAAMIEANADMLPDGPDGSQISLFLASKLAALDLPERAAPIVSKMMHGAGPGKDKAELGLRLATLDLQLNDLAGVQEALRESEAGDLPAELAESRLILMARALAGGGQVDQALAAIAPLGSDAALDLKASLLARRGDWAGTTDTLLALAQHNQSRAGKPEPAEQDRLLKLASAASRSGDKTRVEQVRSIGTGRFADPGKEALFHLLTSDPTVDDADPAKVTSEIADLRQTRAALDAIAK